MPASTSDRASATTPDSTGGEAPMEPPRQARSVCTVVVASDQSLVADAVRAALQGRGFTVGVLRWPGDPPRSRRAGRSVTTPEPDAGLLVTGLDSPSSIRAARTVLGSVPTRWLVSTGVAAGAAWGAALEAGAVRVVPNTMTLDQIERQLRDLAARPPRPATTDRSARDVLVAEWAQQRSRRTETAERLESLTRRERQVLDLLYAGHTVGDIARALGVAPTTVRSQVKAVLHKLGVSSQLAAVSLMDAAGGIGQSEVPAVSPPPGGRRRPRRAPRP